jgi:tetratricopeptide (TPR) repeat protein
MKTFFKSFGFALLVSVTLGGAAFASGDGGGGGGATQDAHQCNKGWAWNEQKGVCERHQSLNDQQLYQDGRALALAGRYDSALDTLDAVRSKDSMTLTMIGYATRKSGHLDQGIAIYHQARALDPNNVNTHEYLGEGYIDAGRIDLAEAELDTLQVLCGGAGCEQYDDLAKAIAGDGKWN